MNVIPLDCRGVLQSLKFGQRIAEDERDSLTNYFVETDQWRKLRSGEVDIVYGAKGSGKSALYFLLLAQAPEFDARRITLVTGEYPRGATVFRDLATIPPASEREFVDLWKLYFLSLIGGELLRLNIKNSSAIKLIDQLRDAALLPDEGGLKALLRTAREYVRRFSGFETGVNLDPLTGMPSGLTGKITFDQPSNKQRSIGFVTVDDLFREADIALRGEGRSVWILLDRLDVAFAEIPELEQNALRALFKAYLDLQGFESIRLKIFLRSDIWARLTEIGFREASHITRTATISWNRTSLLNLIIRRALQNYYLRVFYSVDEQLLLSTADQETLFYWMFPDQVESGANKPQTLEWLLSHTQDGSKQTAPRELIHLLSSIRDIQYRKLELGEPEPESGQLFTRNAIKEALPDVSKTRLEQTLYAEYPSLRDFCEELRGEKSAQTIDTLAKIWKVDRAESLKVTRKLVEVGFFEERVAKDLQTFWVPFLYRDALELVQGTASD